MLIEKPCDKIVGIDVTRTMSGGGKAHIKGIISEGNPNKYGIKSVHVWGVKSLLDQLPKKTWLVKHSHTLIEKSLFHQIYWQLFLLPKELKRERCNVLLSTSGGTLYVHKNSVVMSRDMLSFEKSEISRYPLFSLLRIRLMLLQYIQIRSFKKATAVLFLTNYAARAIQKRTGKINSYRVIPHGVTDHFKKRNKSKKWPIDGERPIQCIYVSNTALYKHQWNVALAIDILRKRGYDIVIKFVGGGYGLSKNRLDQTINKIDKDHKFCKQLPFIPNNELPNLIASSDIYIFASSCENMPNTLLEGMSVGLPIACSDMGPMPEILEDGGVYFQPEDVNSIANSIEILIKDSELRDKLRIKSKELSQLYSWSRCADETFSFLSDIATENKLNSK